MQSVSKVAVSAILAGSLEVLVISRLDARFGQLSLNEKIDGRGIGLARFRYIN